MAKDTSKLRRKAAQHLQKGSRDKALALLREACEKDPYDPENFKQLGDLLLEVGDTKGAAEALFRATDIYARCGFVEDAFAACLKTLHVLPDHGPARRMGRFLVSRLPEEKQEAAEEQLESIGKPKAEGGKGAEPVVPPSSVESREVSRAAARSEGESQREAEAAHTVSAAAAAPPAGAEAALAGAAESTAAAEQRGGVPEPAAGGAAQGVSHAAESEASAGVAKEAAIPEPVGATPFTPRLVVGTAEVDETEKTIERGAVGVLPLGAEVEEDEKTLERAAIKAPRLVDLAVSKAEEQEKAEDEKTIERASLRRAHEEEEAEEKTFDRGAVLGAAASQEERVRVSWAGQEGREEGAASEAGQGEGIPEEATDGALTTPWWNRASRDVETAPSEVTEDDVTMPVWPPRGVLPPPPVEVLTIEIEAELPEGERRVPGADEEHAGVEQGAVAAERSGTAPAMAQGTEAPAAHPGGTAEEHGTQAGVVAAPLEPSLDWSGEVIGGGPVPSEPALDALSLQTLLGLSTEGGAAEVDLDEPSAGGDESKQAGGALRSPLLGDLDPALLKRLVDGAELQRRRRGEVVMRQGTYGTALYVILRGEVSVVREVPPPRVTLARLRTGAFFGEMSLITNFPRSATVIAETDLDVLVVPRRQVSELCVADPNILKTLLRFCRGRMVATLMAVSPLFQPLSPEVRKDLLRYFKVREYPAGAEVVAEGQESPGLGIVMAGSLRVEAKGRGGGASVLAKLGPGDVFGEMSLLGKRPAMASIVTETRVWLLFLPAADFEATVTRDHPELVAYLAAVAEERRKQNVETTTVMFRDGRIETP